MAWIAGALAAVRVLGAQQEVGSGIELSPPPLDPPKGGEPPSFRPELEPAA